MGALLDEFQSRSSTFSSPLWAKCTPCAFFCQPPRAGFASDVADGILRPEALVGSAGSDSAALAHRFEQEHGRGSGNVERADAPPHRDGDQLVAGVGDARPQPLALAPE